MKQWLQNNWFKILIILILVWIAFSFQHIANYFSLSPADSILQKYNIR